MISSRTLIYIGLNMFFFVSVLYGRESVIVDHQSAQKFSSIPQFWIQEAKSSLHIAYQHTSHGSQLVTGMRILDQLMGQKGIFTVNNGGLDGALDVHDCGISSYYSEGATDLGYYPNWVIATRNYLNAPENKDINVIMWSWCDFHASEAAILGKYLPAMEQLETEYPNVKFVYMTGHSNGGGEEGAVHIWNSVIRDYCISNNKILYDFYDIELYDPNGIYYGNRLVNDNCDYDSDGDGVRESNWAIQWQQAHQQNVEWCSCDCAHSQALNCNQKGKAAWVLFARLAGWNGCPAIAGDLNGDCVVSIADYAILSESWLVESNQPGWNGLADIAPNGGDGKVNAQDFAVLSQSWSQYQCLSHFAADFNQDCRVDMGDLSLLAQSWLSESSQSEWDIRCDIAPAVRDGKIDFHDFLELSSQWLNN
jgi:hypothetical protein